MITKEKKKEKKAGTNTLKGWSGCCDCSDMTVMMFLKQNRGGRRRVRVKRCGRCEHQPLVRWSWFRSSSCRLSQRSRESRSAPSRILWIYRSPSLFQHTSPDLKTTVSCYILMFAMNLNKMLYQKQSYGGLFIFLN